MSEPRPISPPLAFSLSAGQKDSEAWRAIKKHLTERIESLRQANDKQDLSERDTAFLRGRISELTRLLNLDSSNPLAPPGP